MAAYDALASDYDRLTAHHDYALWVGVLEDVLQRHDVRGPRLLDVGCGTARSTEAWRDAGYDVVGADVSAAMLIQARRRLPGVSLYQADIRELPALGTFDVVSCLCDVINYVEAPDLSRAMRAIAQQLASGGLLVFDANTLHMYRSEFAATQVVVDEEDVLMLWRGGADERFGAGGTVALIIETFRRSGDQAAWRRARSVHEQHHHPPGEIVAALEDAGLTLIDVFGHGFDVVPEWPLDEDRHTKALYIARNADALVEERR
jgi:SAM-dependent methyltransferase